MCEDLTALPPEDFLRLAVARGGLDLDEIGKELAPEVVETLRLIAAPAPPPRGALRSGAVRSFEPDAQPAHSTYSAGSHPRRPDDRPRDTALTLDDLVAQGQLTPAHVQKVRDTILSLQSDYPAGARYSMFGGKP